MLLRRATAAASPRPPFLPRQSLSVVKRAASRRAPSPTVSTFPKTVWFVFRKIANFSRSFSCERPARLLSAPRALAIAQGDEPDSAQVHEVARGVPGIEEPDGVVAPLGHVDSRVHPLVPRNVRISRLTSFSLLQSRQLQQPSIWRGNSLRPVRGNRDNISGRGGESYHRPTPASHTCSSVQPS